jgi:hypothetical protein
VAGLYVCDRSVQSDGDQSLGWRPVAQRDHSLSPLASDWSPLERLHQDDWSTVGDWSVLGDWSAPG